MYGIIRYRCRELELLEHVPDFAAIGYHRSIDELHRNLGPPKGLHPT
jgi:hypothetical protein